MKLSLGLSIVGLSCVALLNVAVAAEKKGTKSLPKDQQIKIAQSAAPSHISKDAAVMVYGEDGKLVEAKKGTNGFTCIPAIENAPQPDPVCMDQTVLQWANDFLSGAPKPTNTVPGVAYMAKGGYHWVKDGKAVLKEESGAKLVKEPPHWMLIWPFEADAAKLPTQPNPAGAWIMFEGTPYAHLMIHQDPMKMNAKGKGK
jgi:hypothetical protein